MDHPSLDVTDMDIQALVDGELNPVRRHQVMAYIKDNPMSQRRYEELSRQKSLLTCWWNTFSKAT